MGMPTMRWVPAAVAGSVVAGAALAACGTQQAVTTSSASQPARPATSTPASPAQGGALCSDTSAVTRLVVTRVDALPQNHLHFAVPAGVTISDPAAARAVARAVCALPAAPHAVMFCPADFGVSYRLSFAAGRTAWPVVTVAAGGCGGVSGAGPERQATSATFWIDLAKALGVAHPTSGTLLGTS
jgi:hypothetical protein